MGLIIAAIAIVILAMKTTVAAARVDNNDLIVPRYDACKDGTDCSACGPGFELCGGNRCFDLGTGPTCCSSAWVCGPSSTCAEDSGQCTPTVMSTTTIPTGYEASSTWGPLLTTITYITSRTKTTTVTLISGSSEGVPSYGENFAADTSLLVGLTASTSVPGYSYFPPTMDTSSTIVADTTSTFPSPDYTFSSPDWAASSSESTSPPTSLPTTHPIISVPIQPTLPSSAANSTASLSPLSTININPYLNGTGTSPTIYPPVTPPGIPTSGGDSVPVVSSTPLLTSVAASTAPFPPSTTTSAAPTPPDALAKAAGKGEASTLVAIVALFVFWLAH